MNIKGLLVSVYDLVCRLCLRLRSIFPVHFDERSRIVVALTSFPARIDSAWISIESLLHQDIRPRKVILVLAEEEFPQRRLPFMIRAQQKRGLEVLWVHENLKSYKKLLPVVIEYPDYFIFTADDDVYYEPWRLRLLWEAQIKRPGFIIGHRGKQILLDDNGLSPYNDFPDANLLTPNNLCLLTGVGGVLYPPHFLKSEVLCNTRLALNLCPTSDDIWFWAVARYSNVSVLCLGTSTLNTVRLLRGSQALNWVNVYGGENDAQLRRTIDHFNLDISCF